MTDPFTVLSESVKAARVQIEKAQYDTEQARSAYLAMERQGRICDSHLVTIENLKKELAEAKAHTAQVAKESSSMASKIKQFQALLNG